MLIMIAPSTLWEDLRLTINQIRPCFHLREININTEDKNIPEIDAQTRPHLETLQQSLNIHNLINARTAKNQRIVCELHM